MLTNNNLLNDLEELYKSAFESISSAQNINELEESKIKFLGRKSELTNILKSVKFLPSEDKKPIGSKANFIRKELEKSAEEKSSQLQERELEINLSQKIDVTAPGKTFLRGHKHPIEIERRRAEKIFMSLGFSIEISPELETDYYNFDGLNIPKNHPARDLWDTFWTEDNLIPRTHTTAFQQRLLEANKDNPEIRAINFGRCFRNEATDHRHEFIFHQLDGFVVNEYSTIKELIYTLKTFFSLFFEKDVDIRIQPSYFPFVEPGFEMSASCILCKGKGCSVCSGSGWIEILGCGMTHPNVLQKAGIDPKKYRGFAWGGGLDRLIMIKYEIDDIRYFNSADLRFINQF